MLEIKYNGLKTAYEVEFSRTGEHVVQLLGDFPAKTAGFSLSRPEMNDRWDYSAYTTIYREIDGGVQYSDDGSMYIEPEPAPEPEPPTPEEVAATLAAAKKSKISGSKVALAAYLEEHPITSTAHGGMAGLYAVTEEKQAMMTSNYVAYQIERAVNPDAVLTWNETGKPCEVWEEAEYLQLILEIKAYVYPLVQHQQLIEVAIGAAATMEELEAIVIDYAQVGGD